MEKVIQYEGVKFHLVKTDKYKTNTLVFKMKALLTKEDATMRALLPYVLQSGTKTHQTFTELRTYLENLYGATLYVDLQKKGEYHIISIAMEIANEKFLKDTEPLLDKAISLLTEVIFNPKTSNGSFDHAIVEKEKRTLKQRIHAVNDDKMRYANLRLVEEMCKNEPYSIPVNGIHEDVDKITARTLYEYYQKSLNEDEIDLYIVGDFDEEKVITTCKEKIKLNNRTPKTVQHSQYDGRNEEHIVIEKQDVAQGKLNIGLRTNIYYGDKNYFALQVFNGLFGGFPHSKLFMNVREKASLAYYAASRLESHKGLMLVMTGIETKNYKQAVSIIKEQLEAMKMGDFSEEEIQQTKAVIQNQMLETLDTSRGLIEILYHNIVSGANVSEEAWMEEVAKVTKDDLVTVGEKVHLDTIYFLSGMEA